MRRHVGGKKRSRSNKVPCQSRPEFDQRHDDMRDRGNISSFLYFKLRMCSHCLSIRKSSKLPTSCGPFPGPLDAGGTTSTVRQALWATDRHQMELADSRSKREAMKKHSPVNGHKRRKRRLRVLHTAVSSVAGTFDD